jgi:MFS family permease
MTAAQACLVPFVGIAGNMYNRMHLIGIGTILWGAMSLGMAFSHNYATVRIQHSTDRLVVTVESLFFAAMRILFHFGPYAICDV